MCVGVVTSSDPGVARMGHLASVVSAVSSGVKRCCPGSGPPHPGVWTGFLLICFLPGSHYG